MKLDKVTRRASGFERTKPDGATRMTNLRECDNIVRSNVIENVLFYLFLFRRESL